MLMCVSVCHQCMLMCQCMSVYDDACQCMSSVYVDVCQCMSVYVIVC